MPFVFTSLSCTCVVCVHMPVHTDAEDRGHWCLSLLLSVSFLMQGPSLKQKLTVPASLAAHAVMPLKKCGCWGLELRPFCLQSKSPYLTRYLLSFCLTLFDIDMLICFLKYKKRVEGEEGKGWPFGTRQERQEADMVLDCVVK